MFERAQKVLVKLLTSIARKGRDGSRRFDVCEDKRQGAQKVCAGALAVCDEARAVAPVYATTGEHQVVACSTCEPAKFHFARGRSFVVAQSVARERQAGVALGALASFQEFLTRRFSKGGIGGWQGVFEREQRVDGLAHGALDSLRNVRIERVACAPHSMFERSRGSRFD